MIDEKTTVLIKGVNYINMKASVGVVEGDDIIEVVEEGEDEEG